MRLTRPRYTILSLMIVVLLASLVLTLSVARREQRRRAAGLQAAQAAYQNARLTREVAEIAVTEYTEGIYPQDLHREIALAESDLERAGVRSESKIEQVRRAKAMVDHIRDQTVKELQNEVDRARASEAEYDRLRAIGTGFFW